MAKVVVTSHAVERYIERYEPELSYNEAHRKLKGKVHFGTPLKKRPIAGGHAWKIEKPDAIAVVRREGPHLVVLTVFPPDGDDIPAEGEDWMFDEALRLVREGKL